MDGWRLWTKLVLLVYIAVQCIQTNISPIALPVLALLLYFCSNITLYIIKHKLMSRLLLALSIFISVTAYLLVDPLFCLLLPLTIAELAASYIKQSILLLLVAFLPVLYIEEAMQPLYGLVTGFCFLIFTITATYSERLKRNEQQIDQMRKSLQALTKSLHENEEYIRQSEYTLKLEERNRISQEIHDKIGHSLTGALFQMEAVKRLMQTDQQKAIELLQNAINISREGIESIRITLKNMKPSTEQMGIHRLKLLVDECNAKQQMKVFLTYEGNLDIVAPLQWKIIHENVTEALTNALRYSKATLISVDVKVLNKMIRVEVKDNGIGAGVMKKGLGMIGMEERTATVHGHVIVDSTEGFSVTTLLPISA